MYTQTTISTDNNITGIILAGGKSRRMGHDKTHIIVDGESLLDKSISFLENFCNEIIISSNAGNLNFPGIKIVPDEITNLGPIGGIYSSLKVSQSNVNLFIAPDMPYLNEELIRFLLSNAVNDKISAIVLPDGKIEPLCAVYPRNIISNIESFIKSGNKKLIDLLNKLEFNQVKLKGTESFYSDKLFMNINYPEDLEKYLENKEGLHLKPE